MVSASASHPQGLGFKSQCSISQGLAYYTYSAQGYSSTTPYQLLLKLLILM